MKCPISEELRREIVRDIREAMVEESVAHAGQAVAYSVDFEGYANQVFDRLWGVVQGSYADYLIDLRRGVAREKLVQDYRHGIAKILEVGGVTISTIEKVVQEHTRVRE